MSSPFPGSLDSDATLYVARDYVQTKLSSAQAAGDSVAVVADGSKWAPNMVLSVDVGKTNAEQEFVTGVAGNVLAVTRGFGGTSASTHAAGAAVANNVDAAYQSAAKSAIIAIETALGPNLSNVPASPYVSSVPYNFAPLTPGGSLSIGANTITLNPLPPGIAAGSVTVAARLYISGGAGTAEAVPIIGVSGSAVTVTCANTHTGGWTVQSATGGVQEASVANPASLVVMPTGHITWYARVSLPNGHPGIVGQGQSATQILLTYTADSGIVVNGGGPIFENFAVFPVVGNMTSGALLNAVASSDMYVRNMSIGASNADAWIGIAALGGQLHLTSCNIVTRFRGIQGTNFAPYLDRVRVVSDSTTLNYVHGSSALYLTRVAGGFISGFIHDAGILDYGFHFDLTSGNYVNEISISGLYLDNWVTAGILTNGFGASFKVNLSNFTIVDNGLVTGQNIVLNPGCQAWRLANGSGEFSEAMFRITGSSYIDIANVQMVPNSVFGNNIGVHIAASSPSAHHISINACQIGIGVDGVTALRGVLNEDAGLDSLVIEGNVITAQAQVNAVALQGTETNVLLAANAGISTAALSVASAASVAFPVADNGQAVTVTGNTGVGAVAGLRSQQWGQIYTAAAVTFTAGATIGNTLTTPAGGLTTFYFDGTKVWLK